MRRLARAVLAAVLRRPGLLPTALRIGFGLAPTGWWRRWPPLPLPDRRWLAFRLETAYGDPHAPPLPEDVRDYLLWARAMRSRRRAVRLASGATR
jgi:hypothetical protein